jgi:hypothetical protein
MQCDNYHLNAGETNHWDESPYSGYFQAGPTLTACETAGALDHPTFPSRNKRMDYTPYCLSLAPVSLPLNMPEGLSNGFYSYCVDKDGVYIDCRIDNPCYNDFSPACSEDRPTDPWRTNPDAIWIMTPVWLEYGCAMLVSSVNEHRNSSYTGFGRYNKTCKDLTIADDSQGGYIWKGCPTGFGEHATPADPSEPPGADGSYNCPADHRAAYTVADNLEIPGMPGTPTPSSYWCSSIQFDSHAYRPGVDDNSQDECTSIGYLTRTHSTPLGCFEDPRVGCPPGFTGPPCFVDCAAPTCPEGFTYDPVLGLCVRQDTNRMAMAKSMGGRKILAHIEENDDLRVHKYNSDNPQVRVSSIVLETGVDSVGHFVSDANHHFIIYEKGGDVYQTVSRNAGGSWSVATIVSALPGYRILDINRTKFKGGQVLLLHRVSDEKLCIAVSQVTSAAVLDIVGGPTVIADDSLGSGSFVQGDDSILHVVYADTDVDLHDLRCRNLKKDGTGTWL